jgi:hypothetical protein
MSDEYFECGCGYCGWHERIPVILSELIGHAEATADINPVDGCSSFSGSISIQCTG